MKLKINDNTSTIIIKVYPPIITVHDNAGVRIDKALEETIEEENKF